VRKRISRREATELMFKEALPRWGFTFVKLLEATYDPDGQDEFVVVAEHRGRLCRTEWYFDRTGSLFNRGRWVPLSDLELIAYGLMPNAERNPRSTANTGVELYDPTTEQLRAQRQAIYESTVKRFLGLPGSTPFRDARTGRRLDAQLTQVQLASAARGMFAVGTAVQQRDARLHPGSQHPTNQASLESMIRYQNADRVLRNRQDYEETLGHGRKSGFYRVTKEPVEWGSGFAFFVWPLPPGTRIPTGFGRENHAMSIAAGLNRTADPRRLGVWWTPPVREYTRAELSGWLPPRSAFRLEG
jgi:hypothetical protein